MSVGIYECRENATKVSETYAGEYLLNTIKVRERYNS